MNDQLRPLIIIILVLGALAYIGGIIWAGMASLGSTPTNPPSIPEPITNIVTGIGATLATYFGAVLGISQIRETGAARTTRQGKRQSAGTTTSQADQQPSIPRTVAYDINEWSWDTVSPTSLTSHGFYKTVQIIAAYLYFASLLLAGAFWCITLVMHTIPADILKNMGSALIGVVVGVVSVSLNTR